MYYEEEISDSKIAELVKGHCSFSIKVSDFSKQVHRLERIIESNGYSCRVYTENRSVATGASLFSGVASAVGLASAIGIAAHNLATFNPDFEIGKNLIDKKINVTYKK